MKRMLLISLFFSLINFCHCQVEFNQCLFFEDFFDKVDFDVIPYFIAGNPKPRISVKQAKDTLVQSIDYETYETRLVNQKELIKEQWLKFNESNKYIIARDDKYKSFHLINTNVELNGFEQIKTIINSHFSELLIDTSELKSMKNLSNCDSLKIFKGQNFIYNKTLKSLSKEEKYNLKGFFRFGAIYLTGDRHYALISFDIYHKWINSKGEFTGMETGGGGLIVVHLIDEQKIIHSIRLSEY